MNNASEPGSENKSFVRISGRIYATVVVGGNVRIFAGNSLAKMKAVEGLIFHQKRSNILLKLTNLLCGI